MNRKRVPIVRLEETKQSQSEFHRVETVTSVAAERERDKPIIYLEVGTAYSGNTTDYHLSLALSPPAAKQIADLLNQEIEDYLSGSGSQEKE